MSGSSKSTLTRRSRPSPDTARTIPPPNLRWRTRSPCTYRGASCDTSSGNPMSGGSRRDAGLVLILVHGGDEGGLREVALHGSAGPLRRIGVLDLCPRGGPGDELVHVVDPLHPLGTLVGQILLVAGGREDRFERGGGVGLSHRFPQPIEQRRDTAEGLSHVGAQVTHARGAPRRVE